MVISMGRRRKLCALAKEPGVPHIIVEYSANLEDAVAIDPMVREVHQSVLATCIFKLGAVRTRAARRDIFFIADADPQNAFINVIVRVASGRPLEKRRAVAEAIMGVIAAKTADIGDSRGLALSVYVEEIDEDGALRKNNLHARMEARVQRSAAE